MWFHRAVRYYTYRPQPRPLPRPSGATRPAPRAQATRMRCPTISSSRRRVLTPVEWSWWPFAQVRGLAHHTWVICHGWSETGVIPAATRTTKSRDRATPGPHAPVSLHSRARRARETQSEASTNRNELSERKRDFVKRAAPAHVHSARAAIQLLTNRTHQHTPPTPWAGTMFFAAPC